MIKKLLVFGAGAVVVAGALIYVLGVYPPASKRETQGAIGQRNVYRAPQAGDAAVTPGAAPVAESTLSATDIKRIEDISSKAAAGFVSNLKEDMTADVKHKLLVQLANSGLQSEVLSNLSENFTLQFAAAMQQQLQVALKQQLTQAALTSGINMNLSSEVISHLTANLASSTAAQFSSDIASQLTSEIREHMASDISPQFTSNLTAQLAPNMASSLAPSLAQNMTAGFSSALRQ